MVTDRDKIVAGWYESKTMRSALNGTCSKAFILLIKAVFNSSSQLHLFTEVHIANIIKGH